jgi:hypothetical protein
VEAISFLPEPTVRVRTTGNEVLNLSVLSNATILRNNNTTDYTDLAVGDKATLDLEYGKIVKTVAVGVEKSVEGTIVGIQIGETSKLTLESGSKRQDYTVARDAVIEVDAQAATLYDLRLGFVVKVKTSSDSIATVQVQSVTPATQLTGVVKLVNAAYNLLQVDVVNAAGDTVTEQVFVKSAARILDAATGKIVTLRDVKAGQGVMVSGAVNVGVFEATSIMLTK